MENILGAVGVVAKIGNIGGKVMENGKVGMEDIANVPELVMLFPSIVAIKWPEAIAEGKALTVEQSAQVVAHFKASFDIPQDDLEVKVESILEAVQKVAVLAVQIVETVKAAMDLLKKPEAPAA